MATLLQTPAGTRALLRRQLIEHDGAPSELVSSWFPLDVAEGTDLITPAALPGGVYQHLHTVKRLRFDHIAERIRARAASAEESHRPLQVVDAVFPGDLHELEDVYPFSA